jgi:hypothetical protein
VTRLQAGQPKNCGPAPVNGKICFLRSDQTDSEAHPTPYSVGPWASFSEGKAAGPEAGQPPLSKAGFKSEWIYISTLPCAFKAYIWATCRISLGHVVIMTPLTLKVSLVDTSIFKCLKLPKLRQVDEVT